MMLWIVTKNVIAPEKGVDSRDFRNTTKSWNQSFVMADAGRRVDMLEAFKRSMTHEFRLLDDDGTIYYEGLCQHIDQANQDEAFAPLDWAETDVGCTRMEYRKIGHVTWETL